MSSTTHTSRTEDQLTAVFPAASHAINGKINLNELIRVWQHVKACAQRTQIDYDQQNYLYLVLPPELWGYFFIEGVPSTPRRPRRESIVRYKRGNSRKRNHPRYLATKSKVLRGRQKCERCTSGSFFKFNSYELQQQLRKGRAYIQPKQEIPGSTPLLLERI